MHGCSRDNHRTQTILRAIDFPRASVYLRIRLKNKVPGFVTLCNGAWHLVGLHHVVCMIFIKVGVVAVADVFTGGDALSLTLFFDEIRKLFLYVADILDIL